MTDDRATRTAGVIAWPLAFVVAAVAVSCWLVASRTDISVWQDFRRDVVVRDSYRLDEIADIRFFDTAPFSITLPSDLFVWRSLRAGTLPLWDPSQGGGYSPLLNVQNGVFHPVRWLTAAVPFENVPSILIVIELLLLATGTQLLLRDGFGLGAGASACGAMTIAFCGYTMSVVQFSILLLPLAHVPWIVWAWVCWSRWRRRRHALAMIAFVALLFLAGHPLLIGTSILTVALTIGWLALASRRMREFGHAAVFSSTAVLLAAFAILPALLAARTVWTYKLNSADGAPYRAISSTQFWDSLSATVYLERWEWDKLDGGTIAYYFGPIVVLMALAGLVRAASARQSMVIPVLAGLGLVLSSPLQSVARVVQSTPLAFFKPWYLMFPFAFGMALATAHCADLVLSRLRGGWRAAAAIALPLAVLISLRPAITDGLKSSKMRTVAYPVIELLGNEREPFRVVGLHGQTHLPNSGAITGLEDLRISSPILSSRYREWFSIASPGGVASSYPTTILPAEIDSPLYGAFNVKYVLRSRLPGDGVQTFLPREGDKPPRKYAIDAVPDPATHPELLALPSVALYENRDGYHARAHFASSAVVVQPGVAGAIRAMRDPANAGAEVLEASDRIGNAALVEMTRVSAGDAVTIRYPSTRRVEIATRSSAPRILVLHDAWDPGWRVTIDGSRTDAFPVSLISRGVVVPPGTHDVTMTFVPRGLVAGAIVSLIAALATALLMARMPVRGEDGRE
jgi:hypothetical protein